MVLSGGGVYGGGGEGIDTRIWLSERAYGNLPSKIVMVFRENKILYSPSMPVVSLANRRVGEKAICDPLFCPHCWGLYGLDAMAKVL